MTRDEFLSAFPQKCNKYAYIAEFIERFSYLDFHYQIYRIVRPVESELNIHYVPSLEGEFLPFAGFLMAQVSDDHLRRPAEVQCFDTLTEARAWFHQIAGDDNP